MVASLNALMLIGTSSKRSDRFVAVTTMSPVSACGAELELAGGAGVRVCTGAGDWELTGGAGIPVCAEAGELELTGGAELSVCDRAGEV
jgi:hypothetical protein